MSGAMLLGTTDFCHQARIWLRRFGGNLYTLMPYAVSGWAGYRRYWKRAKSSSDVSMLTFEDKKTKISNIVQHLSADSLCSQIMLFDPPIPEVNMVHVYIYFSDVEDCMRVRDDIQGRLGVCLFHRIRPLEAGEPAFEYGLRCKLELTIGEANGNIPDNLFISAWTEFSNELRTLMQSKNRME